MQTIITQISDHKTHLSGKKALEIGCPWLALGAILMLERIVNPDFKVLEFGCGGSTIFWAQRVKSVKSYESDSGWIDSVKDRSHTLSNIEIVLTNKKEIQKEIANEQDSHYDLILIDSNPRQTDRLAIANSAKAKLKIGGYMIIDNYSEFKMDRFDYDSWEVYTFDEPGFKGKGTRICRKI